MKKVLLALLLVLFMLGCTQPGPGTGANNTTGQNTSSQGSGQNESAGQSLETYTMQEVETHGSQEDCWMVLGSNVYDVTEFIALGQHPPAILQGCGANATELFETRPTGSGTPHSQTARDISENYIIGTVEE